MDVLNSVGGVAVVLNFSRLRLQHERGVADVAFSSLPNPGLKILWVSSESWNLQSSEARARRSSYAAGSSRRSPGPCPRTPPAGSPRWSGW